MKLLVDENISHRPNYGENTIRVIQRMHTSPHHVSAIKNNLEV